MQKYTYEKAGRQEPIFFDANLGAARFVVEGSFDDEVDIHISYDPQHSKRQLWQPFDGGWAGWLPGPPTALMLNIKQAVGPVFLTVEQEDEV
ncbi:MAG: hypothetical protein OXR68_04235 [Alphaproteobacteria bacterium]|nr:hypothetical protein [Alphaproteobacteria bacterium]MDD9919816.1 hypothetical protein [Alphaproteobacteria bacterium]